jgi:hypothetical protein
MTMFDSSGRYIERDDPEIELQCPHCGMFFHPPECLECHMVYESTKQIDLIEEYRNDWAIQQGWDPSTEECNCRPWWERLGL